MFEDNCREFTECAENMKDLIEEYKAAESKDYLDKGLDDDYLNDHN